MKWSKWFVMMCCLVALAALGCAKTAVQQQADTTPAPVDTQPAEQPAQAQPETADTTNATAINTAQQERSLDEDRRSFLNENVYFEFDSAHLATGAERLLQAKAQYLQAHPQISRVVIEGHCDERGTAAYNVALGERRAKAVKAYLQDLGVTASLTTLSYGEERPVDSGHDQEAWAKNRRASLVLPQ